MLNRDVLIVRFKQPFIVWVNEADPHPDGHLVTLEDANEDSPVYLIHERESLIKGAQQESPNSRGASQVVGRGLRVYHSLW